MVDLTGSPYASTAKVGAQQLAKGLPNPKAGYLKN